MLRGKTADRCVQGYPLQANCSSSSKSRHANVMHELCLDLSSITQVLWKLVMIQKPKRKNDILLLTRLRQISADGG